MRRTMVERLGKNLGKYFGENIEIRIVLNGILQAAQEHGWEIETLPVSEELNLLALRRLAPRAARRVYLSAGIHGDEPAGPMAILHLLRENQWPESLSLWICPCLNPTGFPLNRRENVLGIDLNRQYHKPEQGETRAHVEWLNRQPEFDLTLCLHEDWEAHGFYLYELNPDNRPSLAEPMIAAAAEVCPIDRSAEIEGRPAHEGIIRPSADPRSRPDWPEAFYLMAYKTRQSYTLEAPSDYSLEVRVKALVASTRTALRLASQTA